jgi:hypothetical protein
MPWLDVEEAGNCVGVTVYPCIGVVELMNEGGFGGGWKFAWRQFDLIGSYMKQIANLRQMTTRW